MTKLQAPVLNKIWFRFLIFYIIIDFARPQDILPVLGVIRPGLIAIMALTYFIVTTRSYFFRVPHVRLIWLIVGLLIVLVPFAKNNRYAFETAKGMLTFMPYILSVVACMVDLRTLKNFININIVIMIYIAVTGILNGGRGTGGYFFDENDLSLYINTLLPFCYFFLVYQKQLIWRIVYTTGLILGIMANVVSFSRGGFVGMAVIAIGIWYFGKKKIVSLVIFAMVCAGMYFWVGNAYFAEIKTITDTSESTASWRLMAWKSGLNMFIHNPLGVGGNNYQVRLPEYQPKDAPRGYWGRPAHSLWFTLIPELGIIGIILYFRLIYYIFKELFLIVRSPPLFDEPDYMVYYSTALALICGCIGYFASGTFLSVLYYPYLWYYTAIVAGLIRIKAIMTPSGDRLPQTVESGKA